MRIRWLIAGSTVAVAFTTAALLVVPPTRARGEATASGTEVRVDNFTFTPDTLAVKVNSVVTWVNKDDIPHVIASNDGLFKSKALDTDQKYSYTFAQAGTYPYYCSIHPKMVGKIVVQ
ncbi:MAG TPA: cupredoxin family copper-binding protein [Terriglobales bacterium]|nr:cupredoxin family copper-binding protein [Terriglobales bacterium]